MQPRTRSYAALPSRETTTRQTPISRTTPQFGMAKGHHYNNGGFGKLIALMIGLGRIVVAICEYCNAPLDVQQLTFVHSFHCLYPKNSRTTVPHHKPIKCHETLAARDRKALSAA